MKHVQGSNKRITYLVVWQLATRWKEPLEVQLEIYALSLLGTSVIDLYALLLKHKKLSIEKYAIQGKGIVCKMFFATF